MAHLRRGLATEPLLALSVTPPWLGPPTPATAPAPARTATSLAGASAPSRSGKRRAVIAADHLAAHELQQAGTMPGALIPGLAAILVGCILLALPDLRRRLVHGSAPRRRRRRRRAGW